MAEIDKWRDAGTEYYNKLRLLTYPLAIKYIKDESEIPTNAFRPSKTNQRLTLCQAFTTARRLGRTMAMTFEDNHCITSSFVQGWEYMPGKEILQSQIISGYHSNPSAEMRVQLQFSDMLTKEALEKVKGNIGFIVSPLTKTDVIPDVILTYGNPAQIGSIIHALSYEGRYLVTNQNFVGYGESCLRGVLVPYITNKSQVVIPGTGDRTLAVTTENEMAFGMPAKRLFYILKNLFKSGGTFNPGMPSKFILFDMPYPMGPPAFHFLDRQYKRLKKGRLKKRGKSNK